MPEKELPDFDELTQAPILKKPELHHGAHYAGRCRNACIARWNAKQNCFYYWREKFERIFITTLKHPIDDTEFDVFRVRHEITNPKFEIPFDTEAKFVGEQNDLIEFNEAMWCSCNTPNLCLVHFHCGR